MGSRRFNFFVVMFVVGLLAVSLFAIATQPTNLGLDLRGGVQLIYQGQPTPRAPEVTAEDIDDAIEIVRQRVDALGVAEPEISRLGERELQVGLPEVRDTARAIERVGDTAQMFFYDLEPNVIPREDGLSVGQVNPENLSRQIFSGPTALYDAVQVASEREPECRECTTTGTSFYLFDRQSRQPPDPTDPDTAGPEQLSEDDELSGREVPEALFLSEAAQALPEERREIVEVPQGTIVAEDRGASQREEHEGPPRYMILQDRPALSGDDIRNPEQSFDPTDNSPNVTFSFTGEGRVAFHETTRDIAFRGLGDGQNHSFAVVLDGEIITRPIIDFRENPDGIDGRTGAQIRGGFTIQSAQDLATLLRLGALPVELRLISQSTVSATLGQQALEAGLLAGGIGIVAMVLFLILFYRFLGLVAAAALLTYATIFFAAIKLIPITLTLPGIAGLILTIGVAADSNVVIFERIKEEVRAGHSPFSAITTGYRKGLAAIIDANVVTLLTAFILFGLATGGVKGFAFTLGIGTMAALFTAIVFTRAILALLGRSRVMNAPRLLGAQQRRIWHLDFAGRAKWFFSASGIILAVGAIAISTGGINFGIDFESGTRMKVGLEDRAAQVEDVRTSLTDAGVTGARTARIIEVEDPEYGPNVFQIAVEEMDVEQVGAVEEQLRRDHGLVTDEELDGAVAFDSQSVGPTFGAQIARSATWALIFSLLVIAAYISFRYEPKYSVPVLIDVTHDLLLTIGIYSLLGLEMTSATVAALLTILGYSMYDTVIVFDRIRENVPRLPRATFAQVANRSLNEILTRSLVTTGTTLFVVIMVLLFGGETLRAFATALTIGLFTGAYSSLFVATPVLIAWKSREPGYRAREARLREAMGEIPAFPEDNVVAKLDEELEAVGAGEVGDGDRAPARTGSGGGSSSGVLPTLDAPSGVPGDVPRTEAGATGDGGDDRPDAETEDAVPAISRGPRAGDRVSDAERAERKRRREQRKKRHPKRRKHGRNR